LNDILKPTITRRAYLLQPLAAIERPPAETMKKRDLRRGNIAGRGVLKLIALSLLACFKKSEIFVQIEMVVAHPSSYCNPSELPGQIVPVSRGAAQLEPGNGIDRENERSVGWKTLITRMAVVTRPLPIVGIMFVS
jgi:hypothetical protein